jgi:hypothetical protein
MRNINEQRHDKIHPEIRENKMMEANKIAIAEITIHCMRGTDSQSVVMDQNMRNKSIQFAVREIIHAVSSMEHGIANTKFLKGVRLASNSDMRWAKGQNLDAESHDPPKRNVRIQSSLSNSCIF